MNTVIEQINSMGARFVEFAGPMLVQSCVLIAILLVVDFALRKRVRAVFRYCIWMLVLVKLVLPVTLSMPMSLGNLFGDELASVMPADTAAVGASAESVESIEIAPIEFASETLQAVPAAETVGLLAAETVGPLAIEPMGQSMTAITWQGVVFGVWIAVVMAMVLLMVQRVIFVKGLVRQAKNPNGIMNDTLEYCRKYMGLKRKVGLKVSANAASPAVCGLFRAVILLPENLGSSVGAGGLRAVLMHELAHIKRGDLWVNSAQTILQIVYFYNPLFWLANAVIRRVREQAVDETVLVAMGERAKQYPQILVDVAKMAFERPALSLRLIGVVESKSVLTERVKHMLNRPIPKSAKLGILGLTATLILGAILLPMAKAGKNEEVAAESNKSQFVAKLSNGVTVELVGVCNYSGAKQSWWRPDGKVFKPEQKLGIDDIGSEYNIGFMAKFNTTDYKARFEAEKARSYYGMEVYDLSDQKLRNSWGAVFKNLDKKDMTKLRIGIATGQWKTIVEYDGSPGGFVGPDDIVFSGPIEAKRGTTIAVRGEWGWEGERRIIAVDKNGKTHTGGWSGRSTGLKTLATTTFYNVKPQEIQNYKLQFRPYEWVEFKNVSLKPNFKTAVQVEFVDSGQGTAGSVQKKEDSAESQKSEFTATLPNGVTVELVGICQYTEEGVDCYKADGSTLGRKLTISKWNQKPKTGDTGLMLKVTGPEDFSFSYSKILGAKGWEGSCQVIDENGEKLEGYEAALTRFDNNQNTTTARFGVAAGVWKTVARHNGKKMGIDNGISFTKATETEKSVQIYTTDTLGGSVTQRIIAIDNNDKIHPWKGYTGSVSNSNLRQSIGTFPSLRLDQIKEFQFQTRAYQWVEFKNVSLKPDFKTDVQVEVGSKPSAVDGIVAAEDHFDFGDAIFHSERLGNMLLQAKMHMDGITSAYEKEDWGGVDRAAEKVRDVFRELVEAIEVNWAAAAEIVGRMQEGVEVKGAEAKKAGLWKLKQVIVSRAASANENLQLIPLIYDIADVSDELHDAIRDKEMDVAAGYYNRLSQQWKLFAKTKSIDKLLHESSQVGVKGSAAAGEGSSKPKPAFVGIKPLSAEDVGAKLRIFEEQRKRVQMDLNAAERKLDDVRQAHGISDLEDRGYPDPITSRLVRLELEGDNCILEIKQLEANIENLKKQQVEDATNDELKAKLRDSQDKLVGLQGKRDGLEQLRQEAEARKRNFDQARVQYKQRAAVRDERRRTLDELRSQIDKLRIMLKGSTEAENRAEEKPKTAKMLKIQVYEEGYAAPKVSLNIPLIGLKAAGDKIPSVLNEQMLRYGLDIEQILKHGGGLEPTTLLDVKDGKEHVIISLE